MAFDYSEPRKQTGVDVTLQIPGGGEIPVTSVSFSEEANTSEVQFNTAYTQDIAVTGVTYSGSFEIAGKNNTLSGSSSPLWETSPSDTQLPSYLPSLTIKEEGDQGDTYTFENVLITSHDKDAPADDRVTESFDFTAERLTVD